MRLDINKINQFLSDIYSIVEDTNSQLEDIDYFRETLNLYNQALHTGYPLHEYEDVYHGRNTIFPIYGDITLPDTIGKFNSGIILQPIKENSVFVSPAGNNIVDVTDISGIEFSMNGKDIFDGLKNVVGKYGLFMEKANVNPSLINIKFPIPTDIEQWNLVEVIQAPASIMIVNSVTSGNIVLNPHPRYGCMFQMGNNELDSIDISMSGLQIGVDEYLFGLSYLDVKYREYIPTASIIFTYTFEYSADASTMPIVIKDEPDGTNVYVRLYTGDPTSPSWEWASDTGGSLSTDIDVGDVVNVEVVLSTNDKIYTPIFYGLIV